MFDGINLRQCKTSINIDHGKGAPRDAYIRLTHSQTKQQVPSPNTALDRSGKAAVNSDLAECPKRVRQGLRGNAT
jgi:hypothetical protein